MYEVARVLTILLLVASACGDTREDTYFDVTFDPCESLTLVPAYDTTLDELASVAEAVEMWIDVARVHTDVGSASDGQVLPIRFELAAPMFYGIYEDELGSIAINRSLEDSDERTVTVAHELGHAFGLVHVSRDERSSVMNPANLDVSPTEADAAALAALWGACNEVAGHDDLR